MAFAEYIWVDGSTPTQGLRSKTRVVSIEGGSPDPEALPEWSFDGAATGQAGGLDSDCILKPICIVRDPMHSGNDYLVLCEVFNADGTKHVSNTRGDVRVILSKGADAHDAWIGFKQEYTLMREGRPLGFAQDGSAGASDPCYCGVGTGCAFGREIAEAHARLCEAAGLMFHGLNAEAMRGRWAFRIGFRDGRSDDPSLLNASDHLWLARYLLHRVAEQAGVVASFESMAARDDWKGCGMHANFSSAATRAEGGIDAIYQAIERLARSHDLHVAVYGERPKECSVFEFKAGGAGRGASIRIPLLVEQKGAGHFEDRRPRANADPYQVAARLAATVFEIDDVALASARSEEYEADMVLTKATG